MTEDERRVVDELVPNYIDEATNDFVDLLDVESKKVNIDVPNVEGYHFVCCAM